MAFLEIVLTSVPEPAEPSGLDEFVRRVAEREMVDRDTAAGRDATFSKDVGDVESELPSEYAPLFSGVV